MAEQQVIPRGTPKNVHIKDIKVGNRFRKDYGTAPDWESFKDSIKEKGILQPITLSKDLDLQAGGRRLRASQELGLTTIPALIRESEGEVDLREVELIENTFRKDFSWDEECALVQEIDRLYKKKSYDWSSRKTAVLLGKSRQSVSDMLKLAKFVEVVPELKEQKNYTDALKMVKQMEAKAIVEELARRQQNKVTTGQGLSKDLQAMLRRADANYIVGDTFKGLAGLRSDGVVHLIECDPPYGIDLTQNKRSKDDPTSNVHTYNEINKDKYPEFLLQLASELYRVAGRDCWLVFWFGPTWFHEVKSALEVAKWEVDDIPAIWVKPNGQTMQPERYLGRAYEPFFIARKGNPAVMKKGRLNTFLYNNEQVKFHPTQRPVEMIEEILETFASPTASVLCPFLGSGNTIRAAYNAGMSCFGWDISGEYKPKFLLHVENDAKTLLSNEE